MAANSAKETTFSWEGMDKRGKRLKGEMKGSGLAFVTATLRRQGITVIKIKKQSAFSSSK
ncbi:MAG: type II secretion system F family protein, partial [Methylophilaceae bacterium]